MRNMLKYHLKDFNVLNMAATSLEGVEVKLQLNKIRVSDWEFPTATSSDCVKTTMQME